MHNSSNSPETKNSAKVLLSSCLAGSAVRYDASDCHYQHPVLAYLSRQGLLIDFCPEVAGGLPIPRAAAEIIDRKQLIVIDSDNKDVTAAFGLGAQKTLALCQRQGVVAAVLKSKSPSCGSRSIYDGSFSGQLIAGQGVTSQTLVAAGIAVFDELQLDDLANFLGISQQLVPEAEK